MHFSSKRHKKSESETPIPEFFEKGIQLPGIRIFVKTMHLPINDLFIPFRMKFDKHIFICTNQRAADATRKSCGEAHGMGIVDAFKKKLKSLDLPIKVRAQRAGCLDICDYGQTVVVYPEGVFYVGVELSDVDEIIQEHILNDRPVKRLVLDKAKY
jgi:(2Fe-2S) ferredoxin